MNATPDSNSVARSTSVPQHCRLPAWLSRLLLISVFGVSGQACCATPQVALWGCTQGGVKVERVTLENDLGMKLSYIDYGATIVAVEVPDRYGKLRNVVLSLPNLASYEHTKRRFGAIMGRYAGRIGNAQFTLDGRVVKLVPALRGAALHGDPDGFDRRVWRREDFSESDSLGSVFHMVSPDGDQNMPGRLDVQVTYRLLRKRNEFSIEYAATTDAPTVVNFTNHAYFNLAGAGTVGLASHLFQINADRYAETDAKRVPTGVISAVTGTALDFRQPAGIVDRLATPSALLGNPPGIDHSMLLTHASSEPALAAIIDETISGRRMQVMTTEPSVQFNGGNGFDGSEIGSEGVGYQCHDGFTLETQHLPDSPNHLNFPDTSLRPGATFHSVTSYRFSIIEAKQTRIEHAPKPT